MPGRRSLNVLVVVALLGATAAAAALAYVDERDTADDADRARARQAALAVRQSVTVPVAGLRGANALVAGEAAFDPARFAAFAADVIRRSPFSGLAWSEPRGDGLPVTLVYPDTAQRREQLLGFDLLTDPTRAPVSREAVNERAPRMTRPLELAQPPQPGVVVIKPVFFAPGGPLAGVISAGAPGADILATVRQQLAVEERVAVRDGEAMIAGTAPQDDLVRAEIEVLGRTWTVEVAGTTATDLTPALAYGASGLALSLVAAGLLLLGARRERILVERQVASERMIARETLQVRITEAIEREIEGDARLGSLARQMVPAVGDICVVHEATARGGVRRVGVAAPDERLTELVRTLPEPPATSPIRAAISSREPVLYTRVSEDREARRARERGSFMRREAKERELTPAEELEADQLSSMIVPLVARDRILGTISLLVLRSSGRPPFTREDLAFAMEVATHAAVALDNARLYEQQRDIAGILQGALVPRELIEIPGAEVAARHRAGMAGTIVGGDFYDLFEVGGGRWMAVVGDVCGKGPEAAALTALARHTLRATARLGAAGAVARVHDAIKASGEHTYCTLCCAELRPADRGIDATVTTAGHPEPWVVAPDGGIRRLEVTGPLVGILDDPSYGAQEVRLAPGEHLFMCSDGIPEARHDGEFFGEHRLHALLAALAGEHPAAMLERLEREVLRFVEGSPRDDLAMFALRASG